MTRLIKCSCASKYQDKAYGLQMRLHNQGKDLWRCTICKNTVKEDEKPKEAKQ